MSEHAQPLSPVGSDEPADSPGVVVAPELDWPPELDELVAPEDPDDPDVPASCGGLASCDALASFVAAASLASLASLPASLGGAHAPTITGVHVPGVALHDSHAPEHAVSQQKAFAQKPLTHASLVAQACAFCCRGLQVPASHHEVAMQSALVTHDDLHAPLAQTYGAQFLWGSVPSFAGPHTPSRPEPFRSAEHAWHAPLHAVSQHTRSTQKPEGQSAPALQNRSE